VYILTLVHVSVLLNCSVMKGYKYYALRFCSSNNVKGRVPCPYFTTLSLNTLSRTKPYLQKQIILTCSSQYSSIYCFFLFRYLIPRTFLFPTALKWVCHLGRKIKLYIQGKRHVHLQLHTYCFAGVKARKI